MANGMLPDRYRQFVSDSYEQGIEGPALEETNVMGTLKRIWQTATTPPGARPKHRPTFEDAPLELLGTIAARIPGLAAVALKKIPEVQRGAQFLREPMGEGEFTEAQYTTAAHGFDLAGMGVVGGSPGAGTGVASVGRRDVLGLMAGGYKNLRNRLRRAMSGFEDLPPAEAAQVNRYLKEVMKEPSTVYRRIAKDIQRLPEEGGHLLGLEDVEFSGLTHMGEPLGFTKPGGEDFLALSASENLPAAQYHPKKLGTEGVSFELTMRPHQAREAVSHEFIGHGLQFADPDAPTGTPIREIHAQAVERLFDKARTQKELIGEKRFTTKETQDIYRSAWEEILDNPENIEWLR